MSALKNPINEADHALGDLGAEAMLVEYGDYECPHCRVAHGEVKQVRRHFGERLCFVFRNFPLSKIHRYAEAAAECAEFAGAHGKFWEMHDLLFEHQERLGAELFEELAERLGLDVGELAKALEAGTYLARIRGDFSGGVRSGVNGTPTYFVDGERHNGPTDHATLIAKLEASLS